MRNWHSAAACGKGIGSSKCYPCSCPGFGCQQRKETIYPSPAHDQHVDQDRWVADPDVKPNASGRPHRPPWRKGRVTIKTPQALHMVITIAALIICRLEAPLTKINTCILQINTATFRLQCSPAVSFIY